MLFPPILSALLEFSTKLKTNHHEAVSNKFDVFATFFFSNTFEKEEAPVTPHFLSPFTQLYNGSSYTRKKLTDYKDLTVPIRCNPRFASHDITFYTVTVLKPYS